MVSELASKKIKKISTLGAKIFLLCVLLGENVHTIPAITNSHQEFLLLSGNANFVRVHMTMNIIIASWSNMTTSFKGRLRIFIAFFYLLDDAFFSFSSFCIFLKSSK